MSREIDDKAQKIHNPQAEFDKPSDVVKDFRVIHNREEEGAGKLRAGCAPADDGQQ